MISSGISSHDSSTGASGVVSMAVPSAAAEGEDSESSGFFSGLPGGLLGGGADDIVAGISRRNNCCTLTVRVKDTRTHPLESTTPNSIHSSPPWRMQRAHRQQKTGLAMKISEKSSCRLFQESA